VEEVMPDTLHVTRLCDPPAPGRRNRHAMLGLVLALVAGGSCTTHDTVEPPTGVVFRRTTPGPEATIGAQHVKVKSLSDGHGIQGSSATLKRQSTGLAVNVHTKELDPGESVDVFWAIFNNPAACTHENPLTGAPCSPPDLFVEATRASLHYVATLTADARGKLSYSASLATRSTAGCAGDPFPCHGLTNPVGAEVHSPMFVPNGGAGRQAAQFIGQ
jgi:hypothetical protein